ncbi:hypothetical protein ACFFSW_07615 [Saccharothrix longispora]|uniref:HEAT repeat protein n=1 Tax=Saccharothrix longispora TaxID=33920 RepID=A0ABU1PNI3_9PSEU|nr:hypothetical protein [Saccharothrix longispora]MDR6591778.1 hypothetical protein [Saccharothrix longispora]
MSDDEVPDELRLIPVENSADGTFTGVQAGTIHGGVQFDIDRTPKLVVLRATQAELEDVRRYFEPPGGYAAARRVLDARGVVVLTGPGTGRSYTSLRLLLDVGASQVAEVNRERALGTFDHLAVGTGYVWDVRESARSPFDRAEFERVTRLVKAVGCHLVIVLDSPVQAPPEAADHVVELSAPPAHEVSRAELRRRCPTGFDGPLRVLTEDLGLEDKASPEKAVRAAELAVLVHEGLDLRGALTALREHVEQAVERHLANANRTELEFALSFAVALLENQPYDEVMARALLLDEALRRAGHEDGEPLRHRAFALSKKDLLAAVAATTTVRDHPDYPGLREETVHFTRQGWAGAVLRRLWREYPLAHDVLWQWMSERGMIARFTDAVQRAVITIVTEIPAHEPLQLVNSLAGRGAVAHQSLAASAVARLDERYGDLVSRTVEAWTEGTAYQQATAVWFSLNLSQARPLSEALRRLELIARSPKWTPRNAVVAAVLELVKSGEHRTRVLDAVVSWTANRRLAPVTLPLAMWITGYFPYALTTELAASHSEQLKVLATRAVTDPESRRAALECLTELSDEAHLKEASAKRLVHLARLLAPTFTWMGRRKAVLELCATIPEGRHTLYRAFRVAARVQEGSA